MLKDQRIGSRVLRKEDQQFLHGRGNYVSDMVLPGQQEVAFLRSPLAHARILSIRTPASKGAQAVFINDDLDILPIIATSDIPEFKVVAQHVLACGKVRHVGEMIAMAVAPTRADAEDLLEHVEVEYEDLPVLVDAPAAMKNSDVRLHDELEGNVFVTLSFESGFEDKSRAAPIVVKRQMSLARQAMVPLEGKAIVAYWDERADQLVCTRRPRRRTSFASASRKFLGIRKDRCASSRLTSAAASATSCELQARRAVRGLARAQIPATFPLHRGPPGAPRGRRQSRASTITSSPPMPTQRGRLLALDAEITIDGGAYSNWPFDGCAGAGAGHRQSAGTVRFSRLSLKTHCVATNKPGFLPYRGVARTGVCFAMELMMDAIARAGRPRAVGSPARESRAGDLRCRTTTSPRKHYDSGDYQKSLLIARARRSTVEQWRERQTSGEPDGRLHRHGLRDLLRAIRARHQRIRRVGPVHHSRLRSGDGAGDAGRRARGARRRAFARPGNGNDVRADRARDPRHRYRRHPGGARRHRHHAVLHRHLCLPLHRDGGRRGEQACQALIPRMVTIGAHLMQCAEPARRNSRMAAVVGPLALGLDCGDSRAPGIMRPDRLPPTSISSGLEATVAYRPKVDTGAFCYASHAAAVAVDPGLGQIEMLDYVIVEDCGTLVNPMIVDGQTVGRGGAGHRYRDVRGKFVRRERPAAWLPRSRTTYAGTNRSAELPQLSS